MELVFKVPGTRHFEGQKARVGKTRSRHRLRLELPALSHAPFHNYASFVQTLKSFHYDPVE
jgi:hypothetical protein